jgi:glycerol-3-phosphate cytidylyltransferase
MRVGQAFGRYGLVHRGHINMFRFCATHCDRLMVGIATDEYCNARNLPVARTWEDRAMTILGMKGVDAVFAYDEHNPLILWQNNPTDIIFLNPENRVHDVYRKVLPELDRQTKIVWIPRTPGISGTDIRKKLRELKR